MRVKLQRQQGTCCIHVAFQSDENGITALFGPSGAGKSSIINMVAGLQKPDSGSIFIRGRCLFDFTQGVNLPPEKRKVGYVFQEDLLFPHVSVRGNLLYGRRVISPAMLPLILTGWSICLACKTCCQENRKPCQAVKSSGSLLAGQCFQIRIFS